MKQIAAVLAVCIPLAAGAQERLTQSCNTNYGNGSVFVVTTQPSEAALLGMARTPSTNPDANFRLYSPHAVDDVDFSAYPNGFFLRFHEPQDTQEITDSIKADPILAQLGVVDAWADTYTVCFSPGPPPQRVTVTEYFNINLKHYFLAATAADNAFIDSGGAGPGWSRTGEVFNTIAPGYCDGSRPVFRFYTPIANTHFFTMDNAECGAVRRGGGWNFEGESFGATAPVNGACPANTTALYRLYNNRWMFNDNNHRFATRTSIRQQMVAQGWIDEGIAMCLFN